MLALVLGLLQVDFGRIEGQVGVELCHVPGPGDRETGSISHPNGQANIPERAKPKMLLPKYIFNPKPHGSWSSHATELRRSQ